MRPRPGDLLACLVLIALALACFARLASGPGGLIVDGDRPSLDHTQRVDARPVGNDLTFGLLPRYLHVSGTLARTGRPPLWDASGFGGRPLLGNPQGGLFYPPAWLAWHLNAPAALGWLTVGHLLWGGLGVYALARVQGVGRRGATVAGGCFEASPYILAQAFEGHYPHVWAASWYPWAFLAFARHRAGGTGGTLALPPILALTFLTGHPQEWFYLVVALGAWALADAIRSWRTGREAGWVARRRAATGVLAWGGLVALSLGLVAAELVPDLAAQEWSLRSGRLSLRHASRYHIHLINLFQLLGPDALGGPAEFFGDDNYWETVFSIGLVPLVLATAAAARHGDRSAVRGWGALTALAVLFAAGHRLGVFPVLFGLVPGMDRFRVPARSLFLANLGSSLLAGLGVEALARARGAGVVGVPTDRRGADRPRLERSLFVAGAVVVAGLVGMAAVGRLSGPISSPSPDEWQPWSLRVGRDGLPETWRPLNRPRQRCARAAARLLGSGTFWMALVGTGTALALGRAGTGRRRDVAAGLLGGLALVELGLYGHALLKVAPAGQFLGLDPISGALRASADPASGPFRVRARDTLYPDVHAFANGIEKVNVNDGFQLQHAADLYQTLYPLLYRAVPTDPREPMGTAVAQFRREVRQGVLDRLNVARIVSDRIEPEPSWPLVATGVWDGRAFAIHRNPTALPRAYVVPRAEVAPDDAATVLSLFRGLDPRHAVVMGRDPLGPDPDAPRQPFTAAGWRSDAPERIDLRVATGAPGLLVVADTWMPGWLATVDGRPAPILRGNHAQRVIPLPAPGRHEVVLRYEPPGMARGLAISGLALVAWGAATLAWLGPRIRGALRRACETHRRQAPRPIDAFHTPYKGPAATPIRAACGSTIPASAGS